MNVGIILGAVLIGIVGIVGIVIFNDVATTYSANLGSGGGLLTLIPLLIAAVIVVGVLVAGFVGSIGR